MLPQIYDCAVMLYLTDNIQLITLGVFSSSEGHDTNGRFPWR